MYKEAGLLPSNPLEWGNNIIAELADRLPDIESFIADYKTITQNGEGAGLGLVTLQGAKAFIPVIVKKWKTEPLDLVLYKTDNSIKFKYLSKRSLVDLLIMSSLGRDSGMNSRGSYDAAINMFSPVSEYQPSGNPYYGMQYSSLSKAGSLYIMDILQETNLIKLASEETQKLRGFEVKEPVIKFAAMGKIGDSYEYYAPGNYENGITLDHDQVKEVFSQMPQDDRVKAASILNSGQVLLTGGHFPRPGNVVMELIDRDTTPSNTPMPMPTEEGVYITSQGEAYVNPNTVYLDQGRCQYALVIGSGFFTLTKVLGKFMLGNNSSMTRSREEMIPECKDIVLGKSYAVFDDRTQQISVPFKVLSVDKSNGSLVLCVRPLYGYSDTVHLHFYSGSVTEKIKENYILYSSLYSRIVQIPDEYKQNAFSTMEDPREDLSEFISVAFFNNGDSYTFVEDGDDVRGPFTKTKAMFEFINRYRFSQDQALQMFKSSIRMQRMNFYVKDLYGDSSNSPALKYLDDVPLQEKAALDGLVKLACNLLDYSQKEASEVDYNEVAQAMQTVNSGLYNTLEKNAAAIDVNNPQQTDAGARAQANESNIGAYQKNPTLFQGLMNASPIEKNTRDVIDKLMFYYSGLLRTEDSISLITALDSSLREIENYLGNCLLLIQLGQMPGQSYEEVRTLLADVDSFLANLSGSKVLLRNV